LARRPHALSISWNERENMLECGGPWCCNRDNRTAEKPESIPYKAEGQARPEEGPGDVLTPRTVPASAKAVPKDAPTRETEQKAKEHKTQEAVLKRGPGGEVEEFRVDVPRERLGGSADLDLDIDFSDGKTLLILKVKDGPIKDWNMRNPPNLQVKHLDRIMEVNGVRDDASKIRDIIKSEKDRLLVTLKRPKEYSVVVSKGNKGSGAKIGLDIVHSGTESLIIRKLKEGLIADWNAVNPGSQVLVGDRIVEVNGKRGDSQKLLDSVSSQELAIVFSRV